MSDARLTGIDGVQHTVCDDSPAWKYRFIKAISKRKTQYKYVHELLFSNGKAVFKGHIPLMKFTFYSFDIREAAISIDKKFLELGKKPVNILKPLL